MKSKWMIIMAMSLTLSAANSAIAQEEEEMGWDRSLALGLNLTDGNSETLLFTTDLRANFKGDEHEFFSGANFSFGETTDQTTDETETTSEKAAAHLQINHLFSEMTYALTRGEGSYDALADVDYRVIVGPGLGHYLIKDDVTSLGLEVGVVWIADKVGGVSDDAFALRLAQRFERQLSETARIWESVEYLPELEDFDTYLLKAELGLEADLSTTMSLRVVVIDTYDSEPALGRDENDLSVNAALVYKI